MSPSSFARKFWLNIAMCARSTRRSLALITRISPGCGWSKRLGRETENLREFSQLSGSMYRSSYRAAWLSASVPAHRTDHQRLCPGWHRLVWRLASPDWCAHHRRYPGFYLLYHLYDVADSRPGASLCRDAAIDRFRRTHVFIWSTPSRKSKINRSH